MEPSDASRAMDRMLAEIALWTAEERVGEAIESRTTQRWLRTEAAEAATFLGLAIEMAEREATILLTTITGRVHRGRLLAVGRDFIVVQSRVAHNSPGPGIATFLPLSAISVLRPAPGELPASPLGQQRPPVSTTLGQALAGLAGEHRRVAVVMRQFSDQLVGELSSVGADIATISVDGDPPSTAYVQLRSLTELSVLGSG